MKKLIVFYLTMLSIVFISGCAQKVQMKALEPAEIDRVSDTKKLTISNFKNDRVGLSTKIEAKLAQVQIDGKNYFTMVSRNDFHKIIKEQKVQNSGLMDANVAVKVGNLVGAEAIVSGNVATPTAAKSYFYEKRSRCADKKCEKIVNYNVRCMRKVISLQAELRIVSVAEGDIIFADTLHDSASYKHCSDDESVLPSTEMAAQRLASTMANKFAYRLTPHYRNFDVALLEDPDLDYSDEQEKLLEASLEYIEQSRYTKAQNLLKRLVDSTAEKSYVAFYNLGVISEAKGEYKEAQEYYSYADNLMIEPVEEINEAMVRIQDLIHKRDQTRKQINR